MMDLVGNCITLMINITCVDALMNVCILPCLPSLPPWYSPCVLSPQALHSGKQSCLCLYMEQCVLTLSEGNVM